MNYLRNCLSYNDICTYKPPRIVKKTQLTKSVKNIMIAIKLNTNLTKSTTPLNTNQQATITRERMTMMYKHF